MHKQRVIDSVGEIYRSFILPFDFAISSLLRGILSCSSFINLIGGSMNKANNQNTNTTERTQNASGKESRNEKQQGTPSQNSNQGSSQTGSNNQKQNTTQGQGNSKSCV